MNHSEQMLAIAQDVLKRGDLELAITKRFVRSVIDSEGDDQILVEATLLAPFIEGKTPRLDRVTITDRKDGNEIQTVVDAKTKGSTKDAWSKIMTKLITQDFNDYFHPPIARTVSYSESSILSPFIRKHKSPITQDDFTRSRHL